MINILRPAFSLLLFFGVSLSEAASIRLVPVQGDAVSGDQATFTLVYNFGTDVMIGGGVDLNWDASVLSFASFVFDANFGEPPRDPSFNVIDLRSSSLVTIGFGNFDGIPLPTDTSIGLISFNMIGVPGAFTPISMNDSLKWAGFY